MDDEPEFEPVLNWRDMIAALLFTAAVVAILAALFVWIIK